MSENDDSAGTLWMARIRGSFRRHAYLFTAGIALLIIANLLIGDGWWSFWPMFAWSIAFACHFFFYRALDTDDAWADDRAKQLQSKSYDIDHIRAIERSFRNGTMPGRHDLDLSMDEPTATPDRER